MDISRYIEGWRQRARREAEANAAEIAEARAAVPRAMEVLRRRGATRVWLIGSLPRGTFRSGSDLDFLVEGMTEEDAWQAAAEAADATGLHVDVLRGESMDPAWRAYNQKFGEVLGG